MYKRQIRQMAEYQLKNGITNICPASMTFSEEQLTEIFENAAQYHSNQGARLVGINMEGPFISVEKKGAQNPKYIHRPDVAMFERLQKAAGGLIKIVDIAPETEGAMEFICLLYPSVLQGRNSPVGMEMSFMQKIF